MHLIDRAIADTLPTGQTYTVRADADTAKTLQRDIRLQAIKSGKR